ncbi:hypothetical protein F9802_06670 [Bacillus aerolatus]|uniref:SLH domain-containing protein n=1 Tax=Bacillus aerolatus TaxID=2653354 RepID=A0A6I1FS05_9BACI|nr:S-layer homology domain-containing protein [Bacillus aerolatus]KAB7707430.1 hypothetical protein F9802_06670 [Bacillus aerolatus]
MAYQPKSYRKFVATAATATLVATAVTPAFAASFTDVSDRYKEAVDYLVNNGIAQGTTETQFGVALEIKRVDAAVMLAKALKLDTEKAPASGFTDVPERAQGAVNALKAAGIVNGKSETSYGSADQLTRGEMALILAKAYNLTGTASHSFTDVSSRYDAAVKALVAADVTKGKTPTSFGTADAIKRGEFAIFVHKLETAEVVAPTVTAVKATGAQTLEFTGTDLQNLKAENISVAGNSVATISANDDGTKATVKLTANLVPNQETVVKTTINEDVKEFKFTYTYTVNTVNVENGTFDNDTPGQKVSLLVNNEKADYNYLTANGYTVQFAAFNENGTAAPTGTINASTGELKADFGDLPNGALKYQVQATVSKAGSVLVSERATITIVNLDNAASAISEVELTNTTAASFVQKSATLVVGDTAEVSEVTIASGSDKTEVETGYKVQSSNSSVISVNNGVLTAEAPGTAKVTVTYGTLTKEINMTVAAAERKVTKVTPEVSPVKLLTGGQRTVKVTAVDQYGDPIVGDAEVTVVAPADYFTSSSLTNFDNEGKGEVALTVGSKLGSGTVYFKKDDKFLGNLGFEVTKVNNVAKQVLELTENSQSEDFTIVKDSTDDAALELELVNYTSENVKNGVAPLTGYSLKFDNKIVSAAINGNTIEVSAVKAGSTDIAVYKGDGSYVGKVTVAVVDNAPKITKVDWVNRGTVNYVGETLNFLDALEVTERENSDDVVKGITLSPASVGQVRIKDNSNSGDLYLDKDGNGTFNGEDVDLGALEIKATSNSSANLKTATNAITGTTTVAGDKGILVYTLKDKNDNIVATTSITVDVPATPVPETPAPTTGSETE